MITVKIVADSISPDGIRLTTVQCRYPRMVHADLMTHRVFSRNGRSSRAVPFATLVKEEPYIPDFATNQKGMVAGEPLTGLALQNARDIWEDAARYCQSKAQELANLNVHKQWVNRMLEWFGYIDVLISSTDWANFFELRDEVGAQPEIQELARAVKAAMEASTPNKLESGQWHLPYIETKEDWQKALTYACENGLEVMEVVKQISVARCARLTIKPFDGIASIEAELNSYKLLMVSRPVHASPAEHIATPDSRDDTGDWLSPSSHGNFYGWTQFRKQIPFNTVYDR